uniref:Uncharacterized protein n=1 Tax=Aegilops tauschii subsp. strangulata TaxID=200361 RepID=A0A453JZA1_AEGTS
DSVRRALSCANERKDHGDGKYVADWSHGEHRSNIAFVLILFA